MSDALAALETDLTGIGLVTPYTSDVQAAIVDGFGCEGVEVAAERHLCLRDNVSFGRVDAATLEKMIRAVVRARPCAVVVLCVDLAAAPLAQRLDAACGLQPRQYRDRRL